MIYKIRSIIVSLESSGALESDAGFLTYRFGMIFLTTFSSKSK